MGGSARASIAGCGTLDISGDRSRENCLESVVEESCRVWISPCASHELIGKALGNVG